MTLVKPIGGRELVWPRLDAEGGDAVNHCESLSLDAGGDTVDETDWYLPSQKEILQAVINGAGNNVPNANIREIWSSSLGSIDGSSIWSIQLSGGDSPGPRSDNSSYNVHCVRRDDD